MVGDVLQASGKLPESDRVAQRGTRVEEGTTHVGVECKAGKEADFGSRDATVGSVEATEQLSLGGNGKQLGNKIGGEVDGLDQGANEFTEDVGVASNPGGGGQRGVDGKAG